MFNDNKAIMSTSCSAFGVPNNSGPEIGSIYNAIQKVAAESKVDHRYILAVIMQESGGCVRVCNHQIRSAITDQIRRLVQILESELRD